MNVRLIVLAVVTAGIALVVLRRRSERARADSELWAEATDEVPPAS